MAVNSKRERILTLVKEQIDTLASIKFVQRKRPTLEDLRNVASTQLPFVAITASLPKPDPHLSKQVAGDRRDKFVSELEVEVICYALDNETPDTTISTLADDLWVIAHANQLWNGLAIGTEVKPDAVAGVFHPYLAFKMKLNITYIHGLGGI